MIYLIIFISMKYRIKKSLRERLERFNNSDIIDESFLSSIRDKFKAKIKAKYDSFIDVANRERKETIDAGKILFRLLRGEKVGGDDIKFLKSQSADLGRIVAVMGLGAISAAIPVVLEKVLNKYGISIMPKDNRVDSVDNKGVKDEI